MQELERVQQLGDHALIEELTRSAKRDRQLTVRLLAELGEVHARGLFRDLGYSTMFDYATRKLGMSEAEAALRLRAAKLGRAFPVALEMLGRSARLWPRVHAGSNRRLKLRDIRGSTVIRVPETDQL